MPRTGLTADEIRNTAIECTIKRMRANGFSSVKLVDIARDIGISHAALYSHFANKGALLDSVSERWLDSLDSELADICRRTEQPTLRIMQCIAYLHAQKCLRVQNDPELYKAFDLAASMEKPFVARHIATMRALMKGLVHEWAVFEHLNLSSEEAASGDWVEMVAEMILEGTLSFHHPAIVAEHSGQRRDALLQKIISTLMQGIRAEYGKAKP